MSTAPLIKAAGHNSHALYFASPVAAESAQQRQLATPLGPLQIVACSAGIRQLQFLSPTATAEQHLARQQAVGTVLNDSAELWPLPPPLTDVTDTLLSSKATATLAANASSAEQHLLAATTQLQQYFAGQRQHFQLTLAPTGSQFQRSVWQLLAQLPYGRFCSYGWLAHLLQNPGAVRAVGAANGRNPIAIVLPCHRVVAGNGRLTGYAGGLGRKSWLLQHEQQQLAESSSAGSGQQQLPL